jgi:hypothetical protein
MDGTKWIAVTPQLSTASRMASGSFSSPESRRHRDAPIKAQENNSQTDTSKV